MIFEIAEPYNEEIRVKLSEAPQPAITKTAMSLNKPPDPKACPAISLVAFTALEIEPRLHKLESLALQHALETCSLVTHQSVVCE